jgi:hypothetical protein
MTEASQSRGELRKLAHKCTSSGSRNGTATINSPFPETAKTFRISLSPIAIGGCILNGIFNREKGGLTAERLRLDLRINMEV